MKRFISRISSEYDRSLLYMLQASEYNLADYFAWYLRVKDFRKVQHRKKLVWTLKVKVLYALELISLVATAFISVSIADRYSWPIALSIIFVVATIFTLTLPYLFALFVLLGRIVQIPVEQRMIAAAKAKLAKHPARKIAIAGSYGKTSMRELLKTVLSEGKRVAAPGGSENTPIGIARFVQKLKGDEEVLIFELGEYYPGDVEQLCQMVRPDIGIITGVNEAHLSKFKSIEATTNTIFELADYLGEKFTRTSGEAQKGGPLYVNAESANLKNPENRSLGFSREGVGELKIVAPETSLDGTSFVLENKDVRIQAQTKLLGLHQVGPISAAAHIALKLGLPAEQIENGIAKTKPFAHRLESREDAAGVITLDDSYNGNPDGVKAVIDFLASIEGHRRWYVTPGLVEMGDKSEKIHKDIGRQLAEANIEKVVLIKNSVTPWIEQGLKENSYGGEIMWFDDALKCYDQLPYMTVAGDVVLLQNDWPDQYA